MPAGDVDFPELIVLLGTDAAATNQIGHAGDGIERRPDLVAHVGEEGALGDVGGFRRFLGRFELARAQGDKFFEIPSVGIDFRFGVLALGDVDQRSGNAASVGHRHWLGIDLHPAGVAAAMAETKFETAIALLASCQRIDQVHAAFPVLGADIVDERRAEAGSDLKSGDLLPGRVEKGPSAGRVGLEDYFPDAVDHRAVAFFADCQRVVLGPDLDGLRVDMTVGTRAVRPVIVSSIVCSSPMKSRPRTPTLHGSQERCCST